VSKRTEWFLASCGRWKRSSSMCAQWAYEGERTAAMRSRTRRQPQPLSGGAYVSMC